MTEDYEPPFTCPDCGQVFRSWYNYHRIATPDATYDAGSCTNCAASFVFRQVRPTVEVFEGGRRWIPGPPLTGDALAEWTLLPAARPETPKP